MTAVGGKLTHQSHDQRVPSARQGAALHWRWICHWIALAIAVSLLPSARATADEQYRLASGDKLSFDFLDDELEPREVPVGIDGRISIPLIGAIHVAGLSVSEAMSRISDEFVQRELLIAPAISLSVTEYRPIFVLGDVKAPGSFPYSASLTVEQAVALAGGSLTGVEDRMSAVVTGARLKGALEEADVNLAKEAVAAARLTAQLADRAMIENSDVPETVRSLVDPGILSSLLRTEQKILDAEERSYATRHEQLSLSVGEVREALANLDELVAKQQSVIASSREELERAQSLLSRGLKTNSDVSGPQRQLAAEEAQLLQVYNQMSATRRELGELQRQLSDLKDRRVREALVALQDHDTEIRRLLTGRDAALEQLLLVNAMTEEERREERTVAFRYELRRSIQGVITTLAAALDTPVEPADTVVVTIQRSVDWAGAASRPVAEK